MNISEHCREVFRAIERSVAGPSERRHDWRIVFFSFGESRSTIITMDCDEFRSLCRAGYSPLGLLAYKESSSGLKPLKRLFVWHTDAAVARIFERICGDDLERVWSCALDPRRKCGGVARRDVSGDRGGNR